MHRILEIFPIESNIKLVYLFPRESNKFYPMSQPEKNWFIIVSGTAAVYKEANFNSPCITEAVYGESCRILNQKNNWLCVKCEDDCEVAQQAKANAKAKANTNAKSKTQQREKHKDTRKI